MKEYEWGWRCPTVGCSFKAYKPGKEPKIAVGRTVIDEGLSGGWINGRKI